MADFVHLHLHTQFSLLDGAIRFDRLFKLAKEYGMPACSITDHGNMFGAVDFYFSAKDAGIKPIIGCEAYIAPKSRFDQKKVRGEDNAFHIVLLAMNNQGYSNLLKLISFAHLEGFYYVPRIDKELLKTYHEGLICLTACIKGEIPSMILRDNETRLREAVEEYYSIFGDRLYFELQDNGIPEQTKINDGLVALSKHYGVPLVATNDCHYLRQEEAKAHELLLCIQTGKTMNDKDRLSFSTEEFYFKSKEKMESAFSQYPDALSNTMKIAEMCNLEIDVGTYHFPEFKPPGDMEINTYFESLCEQGFEERGDRIRSSYTSFDEPLQEEYRTRLLYEIDVIKRIGFASYFLIVADFIKYAKSKAIPVGPGRGSAAGSLIAYCLGITEIDPIKYDLIFERFLNPERVSMPDIDVDFCKKRRDEVIKYVTEKYGKDNVAQIITFGTMQSKAAVRDVGRALGFPYAEVDKIAKMVTSADNGIERSIAEEPQLGDIYRNDARIKELLDNAMVLEGLARHASTHAAGIVIANKHLSHYLPLYKGSKGEIITQFAMKTIEKIGLIKIDFLGLETLTIIDEAIKLLKAQGIDLNIDTLPLDDKQTYELLAAGNTSGVFQLESGGMKDLLTKLKPAKFEDIMPLIALYRPGPLKSGMVDEFIRRKNNPSLIKYETPLLEGVLKDTYGVIIYQEQIMKIATVLAKFSIKDADALRKAMSKKIPEQIEGYRERFMIGATANGVAPAAAKKIYDVILQFGEYGFNKSHSTAYGLISYQTAYLKAHYYVPYFAAILTSEVNDTDKMVKYITECREDGVEILPPDINKSDNPFTVVGDKIRFGLSGVKNVGDAALESILAVREELGGFTSFTQFVSAIDSRKANKKVLESLVKAGCFDSMGLKRSQLFYILQEKADKLQKREAKNLYQMDIFGTEYGVSDTIEIPDMEELSRDDLLRGEKEALGFYFSRHPLESYEELIGQLTPFDSQKVKETDTSEDLSIVGVVSNVKEMVTKRGDRMAYVTLEDTKGTVEVIVFPDLYAKHIRSIGGEKPLIVTGTLDKVDESGARIKAKSIALLEETAREMRKRVVLRIDCRVFRKEDLRKLKDILFSVRGKATVSLEFALNGDREALLVKDLRVDPAKMDVVLRNFPAGVSIEVLDETLS